ncbi:MAG: hypothetical protein CR985_02215 [Flavobacteriales bacterium]|nr:MAG: hypothetical protein CR985_02215 [Flavobacteriales bacterium]
MKLFKLERTIVVDTDLDSCWDFFSNPVNLKKITPEYMDFTIFDSDNKRMYPGQIIQYYVKPLMGIKMTWVTEITQVAEKAFFIDEQRIGPYKFWHHKHYFKKVENGVEMTDVVHYALPFGVLGKLANALFVKRQLKQIFDYRTQKIKTLFDE